MSESAELKAVESIRLRRRRRRNYRGKVKREASNAAPVDVDFSSAYSFFFFKGHAWCFLAGYRLKLLDLLLDFPPFLFHST